MKLLEVKYSETIDGDTLAVWSYDHLNKGFYIESCNDLIYIFEQDLDLLPQIVRDEADIVVFKNNGDNEGKWSER